MATSHAAASAFRLITVGRRRPARIVVFITVLFIGLWDDPTCFELDLSLFQHQLVLLARPILN